MRFKPGPYRDVADNTEVIQMAEIKFKDDLIQLTSLLRRPLVLLAIISVTSFLILSQYASADEGEGWRHLENETPSPERNLWVYWAEGECTRLVQWDELGFHTSIEEPIEADWWLYVIGDKKPPGKYCKYGD